MPVQPFILIFRPFIYYPKIRQLVFINLYMFYVIIPKQLKFFAKFKKPPIKPLTLNQFLPMKKIALTTALFLMVAGNIFAANLNISNVSLIGQNPVDHYISIKFDVSWDDSWRLDYGPSNWDAAWIFVKYKAITPNWQHVLLSPDPAFMVVPAGCAVTVPPDGTGAFIYRSASGSGNNSFTNIQIRWYYNANGLPDDADIDIKVLGIEMVYIPQGSFYAGDNGTSASCFKEGSADPDPWHITSEAAINCSDATTNGFYYTSSGMQNEQATGSTFTIPASFPKGYNAYYIMKYEMSQEQYRDFLNLLTRQQQQSRVAVDISGTSVTNVYVLRNSPTYGPRNSIRCNATIPATGPITFYCEGWTDGNFDSSNDNQNVPIDWIGYPDLAAYSDWAGLRPMTELEYEKACRGTRPALSGEFAWGNTSLRNNGPYDFLNEGTATESISLASFGIGIGNAAYSLANKPGRCGIFAYSSPNHTRQETGATYYGVMEMSGNLSEIAVCCGTMPGYTYTGLNGNGSLTAAGDADADYWPGINGNFFGANAVYGGTVGVTAKSAMGFRGGSYATPASVLSISDRSNANIMIVTLYRSAPNGIRACRTAQ